MKRFLRLPSPAMAVALTALFVALAGSAYAATVITGANVRNGSLTGSDIKNGSLGEKQLGEGKVEGSDIKNEGLAARDIKRGSLTADRFAAGQLPTPKAARWLVVNGAGQIERQSGGFSVTSAYPATPAAANGNVYINANDDLSDNGFTATIALQNGIDQDGDGIMNGRAPGPDSNPEFSGEISISQCGLTGRVTCAPTGTNNLNHFVVSPRNSDGSPTDGNSRKRFTVVITP